MARASPTAARPRLEGPTWFGRDGQTYGARPDARGPIGGGPGYRKRVAPPPGSTPVRTLDGLLKALRFARPGSVVFVDGKARIDCTVRVLTEKLVIGVPAGVTLASDRGRHGSAGALIFSDAHASRPLIRALGPGVRISGLRLRGPDTNPRAAHHRRSETRGRAYFYRYPVSEGIRTRHARLTVDNCELWGWTHAAILLRAGVGHHVHHNHIHENRLQGLGYGVALWQARALVERNLFWKNRHAIAATGVAGSGYEAAHNVDLGGGQSHCFDVHGGADRKDGTDVAAERVHIHHNTFRHCPRAVFIRGKPQQTARVHHNWFVHPRLGRTVLTKGNARVYQNACGADRRRCGPITPPRKVGAPKP